VSTTSKKRVQERRRLEKAKRKVAKKALYASYAAMGKDNSKRQKLKAARAKANPMKHLHAIANCGNVGCKTCFPREVL
jgi:hypothetical protein